MKSKELLVNQSNVLKNEKRLILSSILNKEPILLLTENIELNKKQISKYQRMVKKLSKGKPLQYLLKEANFYGYSFYVNKNVLIPRVETELLVEEVSKYIKKFKNPKILDLCTGSGCIGLTLSKINHDLDITITDISRKALRVAKINQKRLSTSAKIVRSNLLNKINDRYDIIISNPPYLTKKDNIDKIVLDNEPYIALFGGKNGLYFYEAILKTISKNLKEKYVIAFEIGENQKDDITFLAQKHLESAKIISKKDLNNRDRMIFITKNID